MEGVINMGFYVDQDTCIGCGLCTQLAPETFEMKPDGKAEAVTEPEGDAAEEAKTALDSCPVGAIGED